MMKADLTPVHFFSHGSTMMLGEESQSADYWKKAGDQALANKIKGVIMMVCIPVDLYYHFSDRIRARIGTRKEIEWKSQ
jgi:hypothetical protein